MTTSKKKSPKGIKPRTREFNLCHCFLSSQGQVCGLCGNYDGNSKNDFTTRSQETVADVLQFGNSWKVSSSCPSAQIISDPCASNHYRAAWSQKQCSIITSVTFQSCHSEVSVFGGKHTHRKATLISTLSSLFFSIHFLWHEAIHY